MQHLLMAVAIYFVTVAVQASSESPARCERQSVDPPAVVLIALIDVSGSVPKLQRQALLEFADAIAGVPANAMVKVRFVATNSMQATGFDYDASIPALRRPGRKPANPYDRDAKKKYRDTVADSKVSELCVRAARKRIDRELRSIPIPPVSERTDIIGALVWAGDVLRLTEAGLGIVSLWSDLRNTTRARLPDGMAGLHGSVVIARAQWSADIDVSAAERLEASFSEKLATQQLRQLIFAPVGTVELQPLVARIFQSDVSSPTGAPR